MSMAAAIAGTIIFWGAFCGLLYIVETIQHDVWVRQQKNDARQEGRRTTYGTCTTCRTNEATHLHRPSLLLDPEPYCDGCIKAEVHA